MKKYPIHLRRFAAPLIIATVLMSSSRPAVAADQPDPVVAVLMSLGSTLIPIALGTVLWTQERGVDEGLRYDMGFIFFSIGGILGPSTGKFYADQESDAWITLVLRGITGSMGMAGCGLWLRGEEAQTRNNGRALAAIGIGTTGLLAVYDIWSAGSAALETQRRRGYGPGSLSSVSLPTVGSFAHANTPDLKQQLYRPSSMHLKLPPFQAQAKPLPRLLAPSFSLSSALALQE